LLQDLENLKKFKDPKVKRRKTHRGRKLKRFLYAAIFGKSQKLEDPEIKKMLRGLKTSQGRGKRQRGKTSKKKNYILLYLEKHIKREIL